MGKISTGGFEDIKVSVPRFSGESPCGAEMVGFISCLDLNNNDERQCKTARDSLMKCMEVAASSGLHRKKHKPPINYHLQKVCPSTRKLLCSSSSMCGLRAIHLSCLVSLSASSSLRMHSRRHSFCEASRGDLASCRSRCCRCDAMPRGMAPSM